jgi:hypothetical protein
MRERRMEKLVEEGRRNGFLEDARLIVPPETRRAMHEAEQRLAEKAAKRRR